MKKLIKLVNIIIFFVFVLASAGVGVGTAAQITDEISSSGQVQTQESNATQRLEQPIDLKKVQKAFQKSAAEANTKHHSYGKDKTYKIRLREYMTTTIVLPDSEGIFSYALGDSHNFSFSLVESEQKNIFTISATYPGADSNLIVFGKSGNIYSFYLFVDSVEAKLVPDLVIYIKDPILEVKAEQKKIEQEKKKKEAEAQAKAEQEKKLKQEQANYDYLKEIPKPEQKNYNYYIKSGDKTLAPATIYDDHYFTFFCFRDLNKTKLPVVYEVIDRYDTPVNSRIKNNCIIVESTNNKWTLRRGEAHLCVWKKKERKVKTNNNEVETWLEIISKN